MANRNRTWDSQVHCIKDLERLGSEKLQKSNKGTMNGPNLSLHTFDWKKCIAYTLKQQQQLILSIVIDYYNEGAMDLITYRYIPYLESFQFSL